MPPSKYTYKVKVTIPPGWARKKVTEEQFVAAGGIITPSPVSYILPHVVGTAGGRYWTSLPTYAKLRTALVERLYIRDEQVVDAQKFADAARKEADSLATLRHEAQRLLENFCKVTDTKR